MKILITGVAGFIGYHLSELLINDNHEIIGIDNINDYYEQSLKIARLNELGIIGNGVEDFIFSNPMPSTKHGFFRFIRMDIVDRVSMDKLFKENGFDIVINLAAQAGVRFSIENPSAYVNSNIVGFHNVLEFSHTYNVKHVIYASSSSVYGFNQKFPFSEEDRVDYPVSMYAATKKSCELMAHTYSHLHNLPTTGLRFFTVYGPWGRPDMAPFLFAKAILNEEPIKVFNYGDLYRDFTYISDIVSGIKSLVNTEPTKMKDKEVPFAIFNIGNNEPVSLMDFIRLTEKHTGKEAIKINYPMQPGDVYKTYADISALNQKVGYLPKIDLNQGLSEFIDWYKQFYK